MTHVKRAEAGSDLVFRMRVNGQPEEENYVLLQDGETTAVDIDWTRYNSREFQETGVCSIVATVEYRFRPETRWPVKTTEPRMAVVDVRTVMVHSSWVTKATLYVPVSTTKLDQYLEVEQAFMSGSQEARALIRRFRAQGNTPPQQIVERPESQNVDWT